MKTLIVVLFIVGAHRSVFSQQEGNANTKPSVIQTKNRFGKYDMRTDLSPSRLTIAMWDFSGSVALITQNFNNY